MRRRTLDQLGAVALAATLLAASGCIVDDTLYYGDIEVDWTVEGVGDSTAVCDTYGIDRWVVEVRGPEVFDLTYYCDTDDWFTDTDLWTVEEGTYSIRVVAVDIDGFELAAVSGTAVSIDDGLVDQLSLNFLDSDFGVSVGYGDIEVDWTVENVADSSAACDAYGIDHWVVEVTGPETFDLTYDCYADAWFTDTDLWDVEAGTYTITVVAVDIDNFELASLTDTAVAIDDGLVDQLSFDFVDTDFP